MTAPSTPDTEYQSVIKVLPDFTTDGVRLVTVTVGDDVAIALDREQAPRYAAAVHTAVAMSEYNLAVYRQMLGEGMSTDAALDSLQVFTESQRQISATGTLPLRFGTLFGLYDDEARTPWAAVLVLLNDKPLENWTTAYARIHADEILAGVTEIDLDALYRAFLVGYSQTDEATAQELLDELAEQRRG